VSLTSSAWRTDSNGLLINEIPLSPSYKTIYDRINSGAVRGWSETYKNPYLTYTTENGENIFLWYEDEESISEKVTLAKLFGLDSVSVWRLGLIANYDGLNVLNGIG
jgi:spore germination protein YaaH